MRFRFWLITFLIVAFAAYSGAFGIRPLASAFPQPALGERNIAWTLFDQDDDGGR